MKLFLAIAILAAFSSCTNDTVENVNEEGYEKQGIALRPPGDPIDIEPGELPTSIWAVGSGFQSTSANVWYNGTDSALQGTPTSSTASSSVYVSGSDVYVAGILDDRATVWKNNAIYAQYDLGTVGLSIVVSNGDIYVAGRERFTNYNRAVYWKNGVKTTLPVTTNPTNGITDSNAMKIFVSGSTVYVTGAINLKATVWVNGVINSLSTVYFSLADGICVYGDYIYIAGYETISQETGKVKAKYWKRSITTGAITSSSLNTGLVGAAATSISVSSGIVYVCGYQDYNATTQVPRKAVLWRNGISTILSNDAYAFDVKTFNDNVYVSGYRSQSEGIIWENGVIRSTTFSTVATSLFLQ